MQIKRVSGSEIKLGEWNEWDVEYEVMNYDNGTPCPGGFGRFLEVHLECGDMNKLISVREPNKCRYKFVFQTPASCTEPDELFEESVAVETDMTDKKVKYDHPHVYNDKEHY